MEEQKRVESIGEIAIYNPDETIGKHINTALKEELKDLSTVANFATVQQEGNRWVHRLKEYFNLDMVLSASSGGVLRDKNVSDMTMAARKPPGEAAFLSSSWPAGPAISYRFGLHFFHSEVGGMMPRSMISSRILQRCS